MAAGVVSFIAHYLTLYSCSASIIAYLARFFCLSPVNQIEWTKALPESQLKQLQSKDFTNAKFSSSGDEKSATTASAIPDEQLFYENLRPKSHFYSLRTQLELMLDPQQREDYEDYIIEQGQIAGHKSLVSSNLEKASDLAVANLFYYFKVRDESEDESELVRS